MINEKHRLESKKKVLHRERERTEKKRKRKTQRQRQRKVMSTLMSSHVRYNSGVDHVSKGCRSWNCAIAAKSSSILGKCPAYDSICLKITPCFCEITKRPPFWLNTTNNQLKIFQNNKFARESDKEKKEKMKQYKGSPWIGGVGYFNPAAMARFTWW